MSKIDLTVQKGVTELLNFLASEFDDDEAYKSELKEIFELALSEQKTGNYQIEEDLDNAIQAYFQIKKIRKTQRRINAIKNIFWKYGLMVLRLALKGAK